MKHIIENSAKSSSGIADHWTRNAEGKVASEVDSFAAALKQIKSKFSSSNTHEAKAARDGAKIMSAVHDAVEESTQRMHKAHLIQKKALKKEIVENNVHLDAARKSARTIHDASKGKWSAHHGKNKKHVAAIDTKKANASKADASKAPKSADQESTRDRL